MHDADALNRTLAAHAPAAWRCLSPLGRRAALPAGIPVQAQEAKGTRLNGTIGQITDGHGHALPLPSVEAAYAGLDPAMSHLYSPLQGHAPLITAWSARQRQRSLGSAAASTTAQVTLGLTQGVSHVAALFADADTDVWVTDPSWENYDLIFTLAAGARIRTFPAYRDGRFDVESLEAALASTTRKAILILNFPGNPTGYCPTPAESVAIAEVVARHPGPLVAVVDDAYEGLVYEDDRMKRSIYWELAERADPERLFVVRVDGPTKELLCFPGRVGFLSHTATGEAAAALSSKWLCVTRATSGSPPGPTQAAVWDALRQPDLEAQIADRVALLGSRARSLRAALDAKASPHLHPYPFNSGCFALVGLDPSVSAEGVRRELLERHSVGVIAFPSVNAVRVAYCSMDPATFPELVDRLAVTAAP